MKINTNKLFGAVLLSIPFIVAFSVMAAVISVGFALAIFGSAAALVACIWGGVELMYKKD